RKKKNHVFLVGATEFRQNAPVFRRTEPELDSLRSVVTSEEIDEKEMRKMRENGV
ncbi:unnamed protein product, partial [Brassica oleracea]